MRKQCGNCQYFWRDPSAPKVLEGPFKGQHVGQCWLHPPVMMMLPMGGRPTIGAAGMQMQQTMQLTPMSPTVLEGRTGCKDHELSEAHQLERQAKLEQDQLDMIRAAQSRRVEIIE